MDPQKHIIAAQKSNFGLWKLNVFLGRLIPFNRPHGIKIVKIEEDKIQTIIPYKRRNFNHIKGVHACGMATAAEFASGFLLLKKLGFKKYRLIMESLEMKYVYQAKKDITATFSADDAWINQNVKEPVEKEGVTMIRCEIMLHDADGNHVATGYTNWQIKDWKKVKTKL